MRCSRENDGKPRVFFSFLFLGLFISLFSNPVNGLGFHVRDLGWGRRSN